MPAKSKSQQRLMAWVHAYKSGKTKKAPKKIKEVAEHISDDDARDFARTKHDGLPEKKAGNNYWSDWLPAEWEDMLNASAEDRDYEINNNAAPVLKYNGGKPISFKHSERSKWSWWKDIIEGMGLEPKNRNQTNRALTFSPSGPQTTRHLKA